MQLGRLAVWMFSPTVLGTEASTFAQSISSAASVFSFHFEMRSPCVTYTARLDAESPYLSFLSVRILGVYHQAGLVLWPRKVQLLFF